MVRGEYNVNGIIVPNHFTPEGMSQLVTAAFQQDPPTWYVGLCNTAPTDDDTLASVAEPTVGVNGYARIELEMNDTDWPTIATVNRETKVTSRSLTFTPSGGEFDVATSRFFITDGTVLISISSILSGGLQQLSTTLTTTYSLFFR